jgi:hypothetical protein
VLDNPQWSFLSPTRLLLGTQLGDQFLISLVMQGKDVHALEMTIAGYGPSPSSMCTLSYDHVFIASRLGHSLLLQYQERATDTNTPAAAAATGTSVAAITSSPAPLLLEDGLSLGESKTAVASSKSSDSKGKDEATGEGWGLGYHLKPFFPAPTTHFYPNPHI